MTKDQLFLEAAIAVGKMSPDPRRKQGTVIIDQQGFRKGDGYNGFPSDVVLDYENRDLKISCALHSEVRAIVRAIANGPLIGYTLYTAPRFPCSQCAALIAEVGISRVVCPADAFGGSWDYTNSRLIFDRKGVEYVIVGGR
jgi:dCMP deaminase